MVEWSKRFYGGTLLVQNYCMGCLKRSGLLTKWLIKWSSCLGFHLYFIYVLKRKFFFQSKWWRRMGIEEAKLHPFLTSALGVCVTSRPPPLYSWERPQKPMGTGRELALWRRKKYLASTAVRAPVRPRRSPVYILKLPNCMIREYEH